MIRFITIIETHGTIPGVKSMDISDNGDFVVFHLDRKWIFVRLEYDYYVKYDLKSDEAFNNLLIDRNINHNGFYRLKGESLFNIRDNCRYMHLNNLIKRVEGKL